jgi:4-hydroxybenzoyl-CoA thioesterase
MTESGDLATGVRRFRSQQRVRFGDVDHAGIVYYPRILHYCHLAYEDWLIEECMGLHELIGIRRYGTPVVSLASSFHAPMAHGDVIQVEVSVERIGTRSFVLGYRVISTALETVCARVEVTHASVDLESFQSVPIPADLRAMFEEPPASAALPVDPEGSEA